MAKVKVSAADVLRSYMRTGSYRKTAAEMGINQHLVAKIVTGQAGQEKPAASPAEPPPDPMREEQERAKRARDLALERDALRAVAGERSFREFLGRMLRDAVPVLPPLPPVAPPKPAAGTVTETLLLQLSDWHAMERVDPDGVFGLNSYDTPIFEARVKRIVAAALEVKQRLERGGYRFPSLVVAGNGDMISGTVHEVERHTDAPNVVQSVLGTADVLAAALRELAAHFEHLYFFGICGNHGRLPDAKRVQLKDPTRSWDYLIYKFAEARLAGCPNVHFEVPPAWAALYEIEGKLFYQGHGHFVKSWNSIPFYGINRMTGKLGAVLGKHFRTPDYWLFGHFHTMGSIETAGGEYIINPCLVGPSEFAVHGMGEATAPGQMLCGVSAKFGLSHRWKLHAEPEWPPATRNLQVVSVGGTRGRSAW